jgi:hypothetical protein
MGCGVSPRWDRHTWWDVIYESRLLQADFDPDVTAIAA